jgi:hypothetical protein
MAVATSAVQLAVNNRRETAVLADGLMRRRSGVTAFAFVQVQLVPKRRKTQGASYAAGSVRSIQPWVPLMIRR